MRIHYRFVFLLMFVTVLLGTGAFLLHRYQVDRSSDLVVSLARKATDEGQLSEAVGFYRLYLGLEGDDAAARAEFGNLLAEMGNLEAAFFELEAALRIDPALNEARRQLAEVAVEMRRYNDARTHLTEHLIRSEPENAQLHWLLGRCERELGQYQEALTEFEKAVSLAPEESKYVVDLANLLSDRFSNLAAARALLDQLVDNSDQDSGGYVVRGRWLLDRNSKSSLAGGADRQSLLDAAWTDAQQAMQLDPTSAEAVVFAANVAMLTDRTDQVRDQITAAIEANPKVFELYRTAAQIQLQAGQGELAMQMLRDGLKANPGQPDLMWSIAQLELTAGNRETVPQIITELRALKYAEAPIRFLEARVLLSQGEWRQAAELIESSRAFFDRNDDLLKQADYLLASCYERLGNVDQQVSSLRRAVSIDPLWPLARQALAGALLRTGRLQEAKSEYQFVVRQPKPPISAIVGLARVMFLDTIRNAGTKPDWTQLNQVLSILEQYPEAANELAILRAESLYASGQSGDAQQALQERIDAAPTVLRLREALMALHIRNRNWDQAEAALVAAEQAMPDSPELRLARARLLIQRDFQQVAMDDLDRLATPEPDWSDEQRAELASGFAGYFLSLQDFSRCEQQAREVAESESGQTDLAIHMLVFDMAFRSRDTKSMARSLEQVKRIEGIGPLWRVGEAVRLSVEADILPATESAAKESMYAAAIRQLTEASVGRPTWPRIPRLQAEIYDRQQRPDRALEQYLKAIELGEQDSTLR